ncbi:Kelch repeat-containing protein [Melittangium boletus]|uniref:Kelch repeat-containing protein n=1 Tax=Melittangium boletus TaxID=83453 RepID=UPI003DA5B583
MKTTPLSLLLAGLATLATGCQPEDTLAAPASPEALVSQSAALSVGTWTANAPSQNAYPSGHTATLLNGSGDVLVTRGGAAEVYNPYTNTWRSTGSMSIERSRYAATALASGKVLVSGDGFTDRLSSSPSAEVYDPATGTWSLTAPMLANHMNHTSVLLDSGKVLVVGGEQAWSRGGPVGPACELYDPDTNTWTSAAQGFLPRTRVALTVLYSGKVLASGGGLWLTGSGESTGLVNFYDPATNTWSLAGSLTPRQGHSALQLYSGLVMLVGGLRTGPVELFNPYTGDVTQTAPLPLANVVSATMLYSGEVLVTNDAGQAAVYDAGADTWRSAANLNVARGAPTATRLHTGEVVFVGGSGTSPQAVERFTR